MLTGCIIGVMAVPGIVLLIPKFLVLNTFGMFGTYSGMVVPLLVDAGGIFIMKLRGSTGPGVPRTCWSVVLPMARPALITLTVLSFQGSWNEFTHFLVSCFQRQFVRGANAGSVKQ